ncbi:MAG: triose-phosphate isomerase [Nitrososphaerota archaeon]|nr:triose-phosphate isomerase [Nitrososphaerales archaeon]MDW8045282.1 triose-phosphate isomerase [Nitrososphaerota archaeon]
MTTLRTPLFLINFKNYSEVLGERAIRLAKSAESVARDLNVEIAIAPPIPTLALVAKSVSIPIFAQHVDPEKMGSTTGAIVPEVVKSIGCIGSLINHSEKRIPPSRIQETVKRLKDLGMYSMVCARTPEEVALFTSYDPEFVAIEPPELIGSGIAVSKARPEVITESVEIAMKVNKNVKIVCGAGIVAKEDVDAALRLGSRGILVASGIIKSSNWEEKIRELAEPLTRF